jgi:oxygen-independent coproporphyrinogen-3 oxidase
MKPLGLYVHIPFCRRKCYYCDFISYPGCEDAIGAYIVAVIAEARFYSSIFKDHTIDTVFIGGGTPSLLTPAQIEKLVSGLKDACNWVAEEFTVEANPETLDEEKLACYADCGINRLSLGLQTHEDALLFAIGRRHTYEHFTAALEAARKHFHNISADTIFALPGQTVHSFEETLRHLTGLKIPHISCYALKLEEGTKLAAEFSGADEDTDREMYHAAAGLLKEAGMRHYETSNFALPGYECRHNLKYWTGDEYLGLGVAAHSHLCGERKMRHANTESLDAYLQMVGNGIKPVEQTDVLTDADELTEYLMLRLRLASGVDAADYKECFGKDFFTQFEQPVITAQKAGLIAVHAQGIRPTLKGFDLQNALIVEFIKKL